MRSIRPLLLLAVVLTLCALVAAPAALGAKRFKPTRVTVTLLPGSSAGVEIPALPLPGGQVITGTGVTREVPLSGRLDGVFAHRFRIGQDIDIDFKSANIRLGAVDILSDPGCGGAATLRLNPASVVRLDKTPRSRARLRANGRVTSTVHVVTRLAFDSRTVPGCGEPLIPRGYADTPITVKVAGKVGPRGLVALAVESPPIWVTVAECLSVGPPDKPCAGGPTGYPVKITVRALVKISLRPGK